MANFFIIKPTDALISQIYFCQETLYVSGSSCAHHQEFSNVHSALVSFTNFLTNHHGQFLCNKTNRRTNFPNLFVSRNSTCFGQKNCPKKVEFLDKNKFGKLVRLMVLSKRTLHLSAVFSPTSCT